MADPDWTDPCAVLAWLRPQYYKVKAGMHVILVRHGDTETRFDIANVTALDSLMAQLQSECAAKQGTKAKRRAFTGG